MYGNSQFSKLNPMSRPEREKSALRQLIADHHHFFLDFPLHFS